MWPSREVFPLGRVHSYLHRARFPSKERRHIKKLAIGIVVVVGIILLGRLADWFEERSFLLWLVFISWQAV